VTLDLLPDTEAFLSAWLRAQSELAALVGDRVYTVLPEAKTWPLVRLVRVGGAPLATAEDSGLWADAPSFQVDVWAARKADVWKVTRTIQALLATRIKGTHAALKVAGVTLGPTQYVPDADVATPAQPRVILTLDLIITPLPQGVTP